MRVEIWSDVICPWCYIGKRRFEQALARFEHRDQVEVVWRSYELDPHAPLSFQGTLIDLLASKYGVSAAQATAMNQRVTSIAHEFGLEYRLGQARPGNTLDAHRLLHAATAQGLGDAATERVMQAYFCEGFAVSDRDALAGLAPEFGMRTEEAARLLASDGYTDAVRNDEARAKELGITGVPFFAFDGKFGISGAEPVETFLQALQQAYKPA